MFKVLKLNIYVSIQTVLSEGENYFQFFFSILDICEIFEIIKISILNSSILFNIQDKKRIEIRW